jgi:hypothetical protein
VPIPHPIVISHRLVSKASIGNLICEPYGYSLRLTGQHKINTTVIRRFQRANHLVASSSRGLLARPDGNASQCHRLATGNSVLQKNVVYVGCHPVSFICRASYRILLYSWICSSAVGISPSKARVCQRSFPIEAFGKQEVQSLPVKSVWCAKMD